MGWSAHTLAGGSDAALADVCEQLASALGTPPLDLDGHSSWTYGSVRTDALHLNVTKYDDDPRSQWWFDKAPAGCNWQVILTCAEESAEALLPRLRAALEAALSAEIHVLGPPMG